MSERRDWKTICRQCADGEIQPDFCPYYGEPRGCNCPTYHQHPEEVPNTIAMRNALIAIVDILEKRFMGLQGSFDPPGLEDVYDLAQDALRAPPRNCDLFCRGDHTKDANDALIAILHEGCAGYRSIAEWMFDTARGNENETAQNH